MLAYRLCDSRFKPTAEDQRRTGAGRENFWKDQNGGVFQ